MNGRCTFYNHIQSERTFYAIDVFGRMNWISRKTKKKKPDLIWVSSSTSWNRADDHWLCSHASSCNTESVFYILSRIVIEAHFVEIRVEQHIQTLIGKAPCIVVIHLSSVHPSPEEIVRKSHYFTQHSFDTVRLNLAANRHRTV